MGRVEPSRTTAPPQTHPRPSGSEDDLSDDYGDATRDEDSGKDPPQEILKTFSTRFKVAPPPPHPALRHRGVVWRDGRVWMAFDP